MISKYYKRRQTPSFKRIILNLVLSVECLALFCAPLSIAQEANTNNSTALYGLAIEKSSYTEEQQKINKSIYAATKEASELVQRAIYPSSALSRRGNEIIVEGTPSELEIENLEKKILNIRVQLTNYFRYYARQLTSLQFEQTTDAIALSSENRMSRQRWNAAILVANYLLLVEKLVSCNLYLPEERKVETRSLADKHQLALDTKIVHSFSYTLKRTSEANIGMGHVNIPTYKINWGSTAQNFATTITLNSGWLLQLENIARSRQLALAANTQKLTPSSEEKDDKKATSENEASVLSTSPSYFALIKYTVLGELFKNYAKINSFLGLKNTKPDVPLELSREFTSFRLKFGAIGEATNTGEEQKLSHEVIIEYFKELSESGDLPVLTNSALLDQILDIATKGTILKKAPKTKDTPANTDLYQHIPIELFDDAFKKRFKESFIRYEAENRITTIQRALVLNPWSFSNVDHPSFSENLAQSVLTAYLEAQKASLDSFLRLWFYLPDMPQNLMRSKNAILSHTHINQLASASDNRLNSLRNEVEESIDFATLTTRIKEAHGKNSTQRLRSFTQNLVKVAEHINSNFRANAVNLSIASQILKENTWLKYKRTKVNFASAFEELYANNPAVLEASMEEGASSSGEVFQQIIMQPYPQARETYNQHMRFLTKSDAVLEGGIIQDGKRLGAIVNTKKVKEALEELPALQALKSSQLSPSKDENQRFQKELAKDLTKEIETWLTLGEAFSFLSPMPAKGQVVSAALFFQRSGLSNSDVNKSLEEYQKKAQTAIRGIYPLATIKIEVDGEAIPLHDALRKAGNGRTDLQIDFVKQALEASRKNIQSLVQKLAKAKSTIDIRGILQLSSLQQFILDNYSEIAVDYRKALFMMAEDNHWGINYAMKTIIKPAHYVSLAAVIVPMMLVFASFLTKRVFGLHHAARSLFIKTQIFSKMPRWVHALFWGSYGAILADSYFIKEKATSRPATRNLKKFYHSTSGMDSMLSLEELESFELHHNQLKRSNRQQSYFMLAFLLSMPAISAVSTRLQSALQKTQVEFYGDVAAFEALKLNPGFYIDDVARGRVPLTVKEIELAYKKVLSAPGTDAAQAKQAFDRLMSYQKNGAWDYEKIWDLDACFNNFVIEKGNIYKAGRRLYKREKALNKLFERMYNQALIRKLDIISASQKAPIIDVTEASKAATGGKQP